ncbi:hypothetical protein ACQ4LE_009656 [Meloidogyne hapla]|uniref:MAM domain-containing protein n=1 Tax=Meloidogyne hapla TaxID=6305 RepID=A0A1I8BWH3_MELHA
MLLFKIIILILLIQNKNSQKLDCSEFDANCQWLNGAFSQQNNSTTALTWYRSITTIDPNQLQMITGTNSAPNGSYAIVSTMNVDNQNSTQKGLLISNRINCQLWNGTISFNYWTSPFVILNLCTKKEDQTLNRTSDCQQSPFSQGPGPALFQIPPVNKTFRFLIEASNFVYANGQLSGGFAILDNLSYNGDYCVATTASTLNTTQLPTNNGTNSTTNTPLSTNNATSNTNITTIQLATTPASG